MNYYLLEPPPPCSAPLGDVWPGSIYTERVVVVVVILVTTPSDFDESTWSADLLKSQVPFSSQIFAIIIIWFTSTGKKNNITAIINLFTSLIPSFLASPSISLLAIAFTNSNIVSPTTSKGAAIFSIFKRPYMSLVTSAPKGHPV